MVKYLRSHHQEAQAGGATPKRHKSRSHATTWEFLWVAPPPLNFYRVKKFRRVLYSASGGSEQKKKTSNSIKQGNIQPLGLINSRIISRKTWRTIPSTERASINVPSVIPGPRSTPEINYVRFELIISVQPPHSGWEKKKFLIIDWLVLLDLFYTDTMHQFMVELSLRFLICIFVDDRHMSTFKCCLNGKVGVAVPEIYTFLTSVNYCERLVPTVKGPDRFAYLLQTGTFPQVT